MKTSPVLLTILVFTTTLSAAGASETVCDVVVPTTCATASAAGESFDDSIGLFVYSAGGQVTGIPFVGGEITITNVNTGGDNAGTCFDFAECTVSAKSYSLVPLCVVVEVTAVAAGSTATDAAGPSGSACEDPGAVTGGLPFEVCVPTAPEEVIECVPDGSSP